eukprot:GHVS01019564.1.p1 GENE.GHVS01019564.1~~GHVS01019564.1.p1  ORF type:complete len:406 (-),score=46.86 GHVS01019564.1:192-1409(-)
MDQNDNEQHVDDPSICSSPPLLPSANVPCATCGACPPSFHPPKTTSLLPALLPSSSSVGGPCRPQRVLVTGGAGFIGSHLIADLLACGNEVICLDSFVCGSKSNLLPFRSHPNFELFNHDVTKDFFVEVDRIYHLACPASPVHYQKNAIKTLKTNVLGTLNVLGVARRCGARLLLASTSEVYGDPSVHPQTEEYNGNVNCVGRRSCYDEGKRAAEALCMDYHRQHGVEVRIARVFNTYGPNMSFDDGRVVANFIVEGIKGEDLTIYGDGTQTRSFCFVSDMVSGLKALMESQTEVGPINLGNPNEFSIMMLANKIKQIINNPNVNIQYRNLPKDDPRRRQPDISKAQQRLGWNPKVDLDVGLKQTVEDFRLRSRGWKLENVICSHQKEATPRVDDVVDNNRLVVT